MREERKRIFIGNLPPNINEEKLTEQFSKYVNVVSVEIKQKKDATQNDSSLFAFVNVETDDKILYKCFHEISNLNWNGYNVKLELAKESFLERLKREREEANKKEKPENPPAQIFNNHTPIFLPKLNNIKRYHSSSDSESDTEVTKKIKTENNLETVDVPIKNKTIITNDDDSFVIKSNKNKLAGKEIKIESFNREPVHVIQPKGAKAKNVTNKDKQSMLADEKRKKSLTLMKIFYQQQKSTIQNALSKIDTKSNKKIIFGDNDNENDFQENNTNYDDFNEHKMTLFDEDDDNDNGINFEIKKQFEGKKGQKLLELQSRFPTDKRFTLDSRFLEEEEEDAYLEPLEEDEKQKQLEILESVLGQKIRKKSKNETDNRLLSKDMLRFDPQKPEHLKYEVTEQTSQEIGLGKKKKTKKVVDDSQDEKQVEVSKEQYYQVTDNLKKSLQEKESFSLLNMFGTAETKEENNETDMGRTHTTTKVGNEKNPFKYDSSDTEEENEVPEKAKKKQEETLEKPKPVYRRNIWHRNFFFRSDDERFKEGLELLERLSKKESSEPFVEKRRELRNIIRAKVRNVKRNNRPFRKKLNKVKKFAMRNARKK